MNINERIQQIVSKCFNGNVSAFARAIGVPQPTLKDIVGGKLNKPSYSVLEKIVNAESLNISSDWLLSEKGEMLKDNTEIPHMEVLSVGIPHIESVEAYCGPGQGFDVAVMRKECPMYNIPGMEGADFTIKAKGRSMINREYPDRSVKEGDYIGCVKCRSGVIRFGEVYALATSEGIMVKIVQESDREGYVLLESFNKEEGFKPFHYPIVDIHDMALVVAVASINRWA